MGNTDLALIDRGGFVALQDKAEVIRQNLLETFGPDEQLDEASLIRVSVPSGGGRAWTIESPRGVEIVEQIEGVMVHSAPRGLLWPTEEPSEGRAPALCSYDLKRAFVPSIDSLKEYLGTLSDEGLAAFHSTLLNPEEVKQGLPAIYDWTKLPCAQWNSGKGGNGKRATEVRVVYLLRPEDVWPLVINVTPGSIQPFDKWLKALVMGGVAPWQAVISLGLHNEKSKAGITYSQIVPTFVGLVEEEAAAAIRSDLGACMRIVAATAWGPFPG